MADGRVFEVAHLDFVALSKTGRTVIVFERDETSADLGHAVAMVDLGHMYLAGIDTDKNFAEALAWSHKAAESGHPDGMRLVGFIYLRGLGIPTDASSRSTDVKAEKWGPPAQQIDEPCCNGMQRTVVSVLQQQELIRAHPSQSSQWRTDLPPDCRGGEA